VPGGAIPVARAKSVGDIWSDDSCSSSANEYAEGLGCADRRRCRERARSGFEFDNVPREEYFEEPASHFTALFREEGAFGEDGPELPSPKRLCPHGVAGRGDKSLLGVLEILEQKEAAAERGDGAVLRGERKKRKLEALARRCELRSARRDAAPPASGGGARCSGDHVKPLNSSKENGLATLGGAGRAAFHGTHVAPPLASFASAGACAAAGPSWASIVIDREYLSQVRDRAAQGRPLASDVAGTLAAMRRLRAAKMTADLLRASGLGVELNRADWRRHSVPSIARASVELVSLWKAEVRLERDRRRSSKSGRGVERAAVAAATAGA